MTQFETLDDWMKDTLTVEHYQKTVSSLHEELGVTRKTFYNMRRGKTPIRPIYRFALISYFENLEYDANPFFEQFNN